MYTVSIKDLSVVVDPLTPAVVHLLAALERTATVCQLDLVLSCGREGHPPTDPHTRGQAVDVSVHNLTDYQIGYVKHTLEEILDTTLFTVLYETPTEPTNPMLARIAYVNTGATGPHLHVQARKGTTWPTTETA